MPGLIRLSVGGTRFCTTMDTLCAQGENFLTALVRNHYSGVMPCILDGEALFIDRSPAHFDAVLGGLRGVPPGPVSPALRKELAFYGVAYEFEGENLYEDLRERLAKSAGEGKGPYGVAKAFLEKYQTQLVQAMKEAANEGHSSLQFRCYIPYRRGVHFDFVYVVDQKTISICTSASEPLCTQLYSTLPWTALIDLIARNFGVYATGDPTNYHVTLDWSREEGPSQ